MRLGLGLAAIVTLASLGSLGAAEPTVVRAARERKMPVIRELFGAAKVAYPPATLLLRAFKQESAFELWAGDRDAPLVLVKSYPVCAKSGVLGPKRQRGDLQVPEGVYEITAFNPTSDYHFALGVSYPNESDRRLGGPGDLGGNIAVHGECCTIGCIPLQNDPSEEVYLVALDTYQAGHRPVVVHIFPMRMDATGVAALGKLAADAPPLLAFWRSLEPVYATFESTRRLPRVSVDKQSGLYVVRSRSSR